MGPAFERIWGRTCDSLYRQPGSWLRLHAAEHERVSRAVAEMQIEGLFDRGISRRAAGWIIRWVRAPRFSPSRDEAGQLYRIAGLTEDITEAEQDCAGAGSAYQ